MDNYKFALEVHSNLRQQKARKIYINSKDENWYVMLEDLKNYVMGRLTRCQQ